MKIVDSFGEKVKKPSNEEIINKLKDGDIITFSSRSPFYGGGEVFTAMVNYPYVLVLGSHEPIVCDTSNQERWDFGRNKTFNQLRDFAVDIIVHPNATLVLEGK